MTIGSHAIVYALQPENRYEVAILTELKDYLDPIGFGYTGFNINTSKVAQISNSDGSLCLLRPSKDLLSHRLLFRAFSEVDIR